MVIYYDVQEWIQMDSGDQGYEPLNGEQIISVVQSKNDNNNDDNDNNNDTDTSTKIPSLGEVFNMLTQCLPWIETQPEILASHICAINNLIELATTKRKTNMKQIHLTSFL